MLNATAERDLFQRLRFRYAARLVSQVMKTSRLRVSVVLLLTGIFWGGMFAIFLEGFDVLDTAISHEATKTQTIHAIYNVFFLSLLAMLTVSSGIILYGLIFDSEEIGYLLTTPTSSQRIVLHKFQEVIVLSCWRQHIPRRPMKALRLGVRVLAIYRSCFPTQCWCPRLSPGLAGNCCGPPIAN